MSELLEFFGNGSLGNRLLLSFVAMVLLLLGRAALTRLLTQQIENRASLYRWQKWLQYATIVFGVIFIAAIWLDSGSSLATYLGLLTAGLAIALQDLISNLAGWLYIITNNPFELGDRIEIEDNQGDVVDVQFLHTTLLEVGNEFDADQSTGRLVHVPNRTVFSKSLVNATQAFPFIWEEIPVLLTFESDWQKAKEIFQEILDTHSAETIQQANDHIRNQRGTMLIIYGKTTPIVYTSVQDSGILLTLRFLVGARRKRGFIQEIWEAILTELNDQPNINLAYRTSRVVVDPTTQHQNPNPIFNE